ncbi:MAG: hypothetical protein AAFX87_29120 [Bacteroidota bacterium]
MQWQNIIDFGLVVLIWIVQLVIYPSFKYYQEEDLRVWHSKYTGLVTLVVLPLMFGQVIIYGLTLWEGFETIAVIQSVLVIGTWLVTFLKAVPLHNHIQDGRDVKKSIRLLIQWNWTRTFLWSVIFILNAF